MKKKVLVGAPTHESKSYAEIEYFTRILNLTSKDYSVAIIDNSNTKDYSQHLRKAYGIKTDWVNPAGLTLRQRIAKSHERLRQIAEGGDYEFLLHIETDVIVPFNIIELLMRHEKRVVGASYIVSDKAVPMIQMEAPMTFDENITYHVDQGCASMFDGTLKQVHSVGLGCVLIHKSVLSKFKFRCDEQSGAFPDSFFYRDMRNLDVPVFVDTSLFLTHLK